MTKLEVRIVCIQEAAKLSTTDSLSIIQRAQAFYNWITEDIEFCPDCGEEGICNREDDNDLLN